MSTKVLLCEDIRKLGWFGDVVDVADGYARNYLLPQGLALVPTEGNIKSLAEEKAKRAEKRIKERKQIEKVAEKVEGAEAVIVAKANEQGHLFGSVTARDIAENLRQQGFDVANEIVQIQGHIKELGEHEVVLDYAEDIAVEVKVTVVPEGEDTQNIEQSEQEQQEKNDTAEQSEPESENVQS
jgi:large subunit ribosomal protein L9